MRNLYLSLLVMLFINSTANSQVSASDLSKTCQKASSAISSRGKWDGKRPDDVYAAGQCEGFIEGWIQGLDGSILRQEDKFVIVRIRQDQIKTMWDIAVALVKHLDGNPLDSGKPADTVLQKILLENGLINTEPVFMPTTIQSSNEH